MYKVVIGFDTPTPQDFMFRESDKACEFADRYHELVNSHVDIYVFEESDMDDHIDEWLSNKFIINFNDIKFIKGEPFALDYLPF